MKNLIQPLTLVVFFFFSYSHSFAEETQQPEDFVTAVVFVDANQRESIYAFKNTVPTSEIKSLEQKLSTLKDVQGVTVTGNYIKLIWGDRYPLTMANLAVAKVLRTFFKVGACVVIDARQYSMAKLHGLLDR